MKFKTVIVGALACALLAPASWAAPAKAVMAPINQFIDAFDKGDAKTAAAQYASGEITIIDEVPPHRWLGATAFQDWAADLEKNAKETGITDPGVKLGKATRAVISGENAYVIVPSVYSYKQRGQAMAEAGQMTFVLARTGEEWKISGWTWTGPNPHAVHRARAQKTKP